MTKEEFETFTRELDGCKDFICVAKFGDSVETRAYGSFIGIAHLIIQGTIAITRQFGDGDAERQQHYLNVIAATLTTLAREGEAKRKSAQAAAAALSAKGK